MIENCIKSGGIINQEMFWNQIGQFCFRNLDHQLNDVDPIDFLTITSFEIQRLAEIGKNERERRSFTFSSVQFMNLAHISGELK